MRFICIINLQENAHEKNATRDTEEGLALGYSSSAVAEGVQVLELVKGDWVISSQVLCALPNLGVVFGHVLSESNYRWLVKVPPGLWAGQGLREPREVGPREGAIIVRVQRLEYVEQGVFGGPRVGPSRCKSCDRGQEE